MEEDEEDVVMQGSELYKYLLEHGATGFESLTQRDLHPTVLEVQARSEWRTELSKLFSFGYLQGLYNEFSGSALDSGLSTLMMAVLRSPLISPDDAVWLKSYSELSQNKVVTKKQLDEVAWFQVWNSALGSIFSVLGISALSAKLVVWGYQRHRQRCRLQLVKELLANMQSFCRDARRAINLVQEHELLHRGYLMAASAVQVWRLEAAAPGFTPSLPQLRSALLEALTAACGDVARTTRQLRAVQRLVSAMDLPLLPLGSDLPHDENITLVQLKGTFQQFLLLESELLRHLALNFIPSAWQPSPPPRVPLTLAACRALSARLAAARAVLSPALHLARAGSATVPRSPEPRQASRLLALHVALHSAALHTQGVLSHLLAATDFAQEHENKINCDDTQEIKYFTSELMKRLEASQIELVSLRDCVAEAELRVSKIQKRTEPVVPFVEVANPEAGPVADHRVIRVGVTDLEPRGPDQVFEGTSCLERTELGDGEEVMAGRKRDRQVSQRLYNELQSVLAVRAEEWRVREARALGQDATPAVRPGKPPETPSVADSSCGSQQSGANQVPVVRDLPSESDIENLPCDEWPLNALPSRPRAPARRKSSPRIREIEGAVPTKTPPQLCPPPPPPLPPPPPPVPPAAGSAFLLAGLAAARAREFPLAAEDNFGDQTDDDDDDDDE